MTRKDLQDYEVQPSTKHHHNSHVKGLWMTPCSGDKVLFPQKCLSIDIKNCYKSISFVLINRWLHSQDSMCSVQNLTCCQSKSQDFRESHFILLPLLVTAHIVCTKVCSWAVFGIPESLSKTKTYEQSSAHLTQLYRSVTFPSSPNLWHGRRIIWSHSAFSTTSKPHNLSNGIWQGNVMVRECNTGLLKHMRTAETKDRNNESSASVMQIMISGKNWVTVPFSM